MRHAPHHGLRRGIEPLSQHADAEVLLKRQPEDDTETVVTVVYVTASKTFDGPIGGYTTLGQTTTTNKQEQTTTTDSSSTRGKHPSVASTSVNFHVSAASTQPGDDFAAASATGGTSLLSSTTSQPDAQNTSATLDSASKSPGMTSGAKAGLALGLLLGLGIVLGLILLFFRRKRQQQAVYSKTNDEKTGFDNGTPKTLNPVSLGQSPVMASAAPPRLSLRPVAAFLPAFGRGRQSAYALSNAVSPSDGIESTQHTQVSPEALQFAQGPRQNAGEVNYSNNPQNPFGNYAEKSYHGDDMNPDDTAQPHVHGSGVRQQMEPKSPRDQVGIALAKSNSSLEETGETSNKPEPSVKHSLTAAVKVDAIDPSRGMSPQQKENAPVQGPILLNVHRVQMDFKPSMDDELELRAGQLVRLLHEYDDGWALCIRLDRSQQGVVPRTCLSGNPLKPRIGDSKQSSRPMNPPLHLESAITEQSQATYSQTEHSPESNTKGTPNMKHRASQSTCSIPAFPLPNKDGLLKSNLTTHDAQNAEPNSFASRPRSNSASQAISTTKSTSEQVFPTSDECHRMSLGNPPQVQAKPALNRKPVPGQAL